MPCENSARKRSKTMAFRCTPEERKLICEMAAWSGMNRQDYIIAKLTDTQVEVRPSVSVQKALKDSMAELAKEVRLAASYGELSGSLQQRLELVMRFFLALGEGVEAPVTEAPPQTSHGCTSWKSSIARPSMRSSRNIDLATSRGSRPSSITGHCSRLSRWRSCSA